MLAEAAKGNKRAQLAMSVFIHRLQAGLGQMIASLQAAPHAIVFTDVIGISEPGIRAQACEPFQFMGWKSTPRKTPNRQLTRTSQRPIAQFAS